MDTIKSAVDDDEPTMRHLNKWCKDSSLTDWHGFAVRLVGENDAKSIAAKHCGGGYHFALQEMLKAWYESTVDRSWQMIIIALNELERNDVIESIEEECKITKAT